MDSGQLVGFDANSIPSGLYLEGQVKSVWASLSESVLRDQSLFDRAARLQDDFMHQYQTLRETSAQVLRDQMCTKQLDCATTTTTTRVKFNK